MGFLSYLSVPRVAASFWRAATKEEIDGWKKDGLEIAEIRLDLADIPNGAAALELVSVYADAGLPVILTIRPQNEGGGWNKTEAERFELFLELLQDLPGTMVKAVDIELAAVIRRTIIDAAELYGAASIVSRHNFAAADTAKEIKEAASRAFAGGADIFKTAGMIFDEDDLAVMRDFLRGEKKGKKRPIIATGMGTTAAARRARLELCGYGSRLAFAAIGQTSAPGQLSLKETVAAVRG